MAYNKIIFGNRTLIDLTGDSVTPEDLASGKTAHDMSGEIITGTNTKDVDSTDATATEQEILDGKTAYARSVMLTGSMPNNGGVKETLKKAEEVYSIPVGYHDGSGTVGIDTDEAAKLVPANIREGITILGVEGTMSGSEDVKAQSKEVTPTTSAQTVLPDADEGYNYLSQVIVAGIPYAETRNSAGGLTVTIG